MSESAIVVPVTLQVVCRMGHVGRIENVFPPEPEVAGYIQPCGLCGGRADWRRSRPAITKIGTSDQLNPNQR